MNYLLLRIGALALAAIPMNVVPASELLINGSFELPAISTNDQEFQSPSTAIVGWTVTERSVNINRTSAIFGTAYNGDQMLEINGHDNGAVQQAFLTVMGAPYLLTLAYANNPNPSLASPPYHADVMLLGSGTLYSEFLTHEGSTSADMQWTLLSHAFVANSTTTILQLRSRSQGFNGVVFDAVSVATVPEPAAIAIFAPGLMGVLLVRHRLRTTNTRRV